MTSSPVSTLAAVLLLAGGLALVLVALYLGLLAGSYLVEGG